MHEHDDDLESEVHEQAEKETDSYPDTGDDLDVVNRGAAEDDAADDEREPDLDKDEAEI